MALTITLRLDGQCSLELAKNQQKIGHYFENPDSALSAGINLIKVAFLSKLIKETGSGEIQQALAELVEHTTNEIFGDSNFCEGVKKQLEMNRPKCEDCGGKLNNESYPCQEIRGTICSKCIKVHLVHCSECAIHHHQVKTWPHFEIKSSSYWECLKKKCFICSEEFIITSPQINHLISISSGNVVVPKEIYHCISINYDKIRELCSEKCYRAHQDNLCLQFQKTRKIMSCMCHDHLECEACAGNCIVCNQHLDMVLSKAYKICVISELGICSEKCDKKHQGVCKGCKSCAA